MYSVADVPAFRIYGATWTSAMHANTDATPPEHQIAFLKRLSEATVHLNSQTNRSIDPCDMHLVQIRSCSIRRGSHLFYLIRSISTSKYMIGISSSCRACLSLASSCFVRPVSPALFLSLKPQSSSVALFLLLMESPFVPSLIDGSSRNT